MEYIDSHLHLSMIEDKGIDLKALREELLESGFIGGVDIGIREGDLEERMAVARGFDSLLFSAGMYPSRAATSDLDASLAILEEDVRNHPVAAIGEIGLDHYHDYASREAQRKLFVAQIELANRHRLPVLIHSRDADGPMLEVLSTNTPGYGFIMHCYSSGPEFAGRILDLGGHLSFAGNLTYKKNTEIQEALRLCPSDRLLLETDSPYLAPVPRRGKTNTPLLIRHTYRYASELRGMETEQLAMQVVENYRRFFGL